MLYLLLRYMCYIGETERTFGTRLDEHKKEVETVTTRRFTRETRKCSTYVEHKSAITNHADRRNCVIDWKGAKVVDKEMKVDKETNRCARWIKESIWIRKTEPTMNRDEGGYRLSHVWDSLLATPSSEQRPRNIQFLKKTADGGRNIEVSRTFLVV